MHNPKVEDKTKAIKMSNERRSVHFADSIDVVPQASNGASATTVAVETVEHCDDASNNSTTFSVSVNRSAWSSSETSFFARNRPALTQLDLAPTRPIRSLDSILTDALSVCDTFPISTGDENYGLAQQLPPSLDLDTSLFSLMEEEKDDDSASSRLLSPRNSIPLDSSYIISQAMKHILK